MNYRRLSTFTNFNLNSEYNDNNHNKFLFFSLKKENCFHTICFPVKYKKALEVPIFSPQLYHFSHSDTPTSMPVETAAFTAVVALLITAAASQTPPTAYSNHTVGGPAGWFFNSTENISATNYSSWAASQTFNLGDFLSKLNLSSSSFRLCS